MLLNSNVLSFDRKIKEALLAMKMEQVLSKDKILEIYLNGIYLGNGAYGVAAAAQSYFNKPLDQLDDAEAASLAALPKSPTNYNPFLHPQAAMARRNLVLDLMVEAGVLTRQQADQEKQEPLVPQQKQRFGPLPDSEWFGEEVRRQLIAQYGQERAAQGGLEVHTSLDQSLQVTETRLLHEGLMNYDRVHSGWRGLCATCRTFRMMAGKVFSITSRLRAVCCVSGVWPSCCLGRRMWAGSRKVRPARAHFLRRILPGRAGCIRFGSVTSS